jgi:CRISPR-associated endonuclease/helicase Cas3
MVIWLLALGHVARTAELDNFPRRLIYVVNRRTVVDQATREAEELRAALIENPALKPVADSLRKLAAQQTQSPLAISTLRGQFADNAEWRVDPARPAVVVGTVDMIGSRLLFSGYGRGFKSRPLHASFLGQDSLVIHDEAHLEPAFQALLSSVEKEQGRRGDIRPLRLMALSATTRATNESQFDLGDEDQHHPLVCKRIQAKKGIAFHPVDQAASIPDKVAEIAQGYKDSNAKVLIYLRRLDHVEKVVCSLAKAKMAHQVLTGTVRGLERDALAREDPVFARFMPKPQVPPQTGTVFLVSTSAGEVGVDLSADHLVCDLTPFDSMVQRFGRINRFGEGNAHIDLVHTAVSALTRQEAADVAESTDSESSNESPSNRRDPTTPYDLACAKTLALLHSLPKDREDRHSASPADLNALPESQRQDAFTPTPGILPATDVLFDAWAMTSLREALPGRPPVAAWLHGVTQWEPPETRVAWRTEVEVISGDLMDLYEPADLLEDYPLKPQELLRDMTDRVFRQLERIAGRCPEANTWLVAADGRVSMQSMAHLVRRDRQNKPIVDLADCTVLLQPKAGGFRNGFLDGDSPFNRAFRYDVADDWQDSEGRPRRLRLIGDEEVPRGMRLIRTIAIEKEPDQADEESAEASTTLWSWYVRPVSADDDGSRTAREPQALQAHLEKARYFASLLATKLALHDPEARAVTLAAEWHDLGKARKVWQRAIGNYSYPQRVFAKSAGDLPSIDLSGYRHELGSLLDLRSVQETQEQNQELQELMLHLIASHHGRARPHFPSSEIFDPDHADAETEETAREIPRRFARLQHRYGRWGLAYLESLVRAADALASQQLEEKQDHPLAGPFQGGREVYP